MRFKIISDNVYGLKQTQNDFYEFLQVTTEGKLEQVPAKLLTYDGSDLRSWGVANVTFGLTVIFEQPSHHLPLSPDLIPGGQASPSLSLLVISRLPRPRCLEITLR